HLRRDPRGRRVQRRPEEGRRDRGRDALARPPRGGLATREAHRLRPRPRARASRGRRLRRTPRARRSSLTMAGTTSSGGGRRGGGMIVGINVTPMVDVVLVLLVIMMVSATYVVAQSMKVDLPKSSESDGGESSTHIVSVEADGDFLFNAEPVTEREL